MKNKKITVKDLLTMFQPGTVLLPPVIVRSRVASQSATDQIDARVELSRGSDEEIYPFIVEAKAQSTPLAIRTAVVQAKAAVAKNELPLIAVPYLSTERLEELEKEGVSGVDLCGNGVIIVPGRLYVMRTGKPNLYRESRPLNNPYAGRSALVARMLLERTQWPSLNELVAAIRNAGADISLAQASKAIKAMNEDLVIAKRNRTITLTDPLQLLDRLGQAWEELRDIRYEAFRLPSGVDWAAALSSDSKLNWAITGQSSASRYVVFGQSGPLRIAVTDQLLAAKLLPGKAEPIAQFADIELVETDEPGYYFQNEPDQGKRWASRLQTWLELQAGDARQQEAAREIRNQILKGRQP